MRSQLFFCRTFVLLLALAFVRTTFATSPNYTVTTTSGATIVPGTTDVGNHCDDCLTSITFPFPVIFYDQIFTSAFVSSNGNLQFSSGAPLSSACLPSANANNVIAPWWSDLYTLGNNTNNGSQPNGIFTSVSGSAPNRIFNIEWRASQSPTESNGYYNFEVRLYEGQQRIDFIYGAPTDVGGVTGGIGVQRDLGTQFVSVACSGIPAAGTQYTFAIETCTPAPPDMIAWWPGDGNADDIQGGNNGTLVGGATATGTGEVRQSFTFDGTSGHVFVSDSPALNPSTEITVDAWVKTSSAAFQGLVSKFNHNGNSTDESYNLSLEVDGTVRWQVVTTASGYILVSPSSIADGLWHHVAGTYDGGTLILYVDGSPVSSTPASGTILSSSTPLYLGAALVNNLNSAFLGGQLDEVEIFSRALTADEIVSIYSAGSNGKCQCTPPPAGMVSWWPGDGNAIDIQGGNNGTPSGTETFAPGEVGQAFSLDGSSFESMGNPATLNITGNQVTMDGWINPTSNNTAIYFGKTATGSNDYLLLLQFGQLSSIIKTGGVETLANGYSDFPTNAVPFVPPTGQWTHIALTYDGTTIKLYANGSQVGQASTSGNIDGDNVPFNIGGRSSGDFFTGLIDEVEVFSRALLQSEIQAIYGAGSAGKCRPKPSGLYAATGSMGTAGSLYHIDPATAASSLIGPITNISDGGALGMTGLAFRPSDGTLYGITTSLSQSAKSLVTINPNTADATVIGSLGTGDSDISFRSVGTLFGFSSGGSGSLNTINLSTGAATGLNSSGISPTVGGGLAFSPGGTLYLSGTGDGGTLDTLNPATGDRTAGPTLTGAPFAAGGAINAMKFDANGVLFGSDGDRTSLANTDLVTINTSSGAVTNIGALPAFTDAIAFAPSPAPTPVARQLANISSRADVGTGDNVAIGGFVIHSDPASVRTVPSSVPTKKVLIRGLGPSLAASGVTTPLADPVLDLYNSNGTKIDHNDNWMEGADDLPNPARAAAIQATGLAPSDPNEAALLETLNADSAYTAILSGKNAGTGIGLVEIYDLEVTTNTHLANISTRAFVGTGDNVLIGGFVVQGDTPARVLLRAIGPSLASAGISGALQDPVLELHDTNGALVASNDDWTSSPDATAITATGLAPSNTKESAILFTPAPGAYTAIVRGVGGTTGVGLVEAYRLAN